MSGAETFMSRSSVLKALLWACAYIAIAGALIGANPFRGETTGPFDRLAYYQGWNPDGQPVEVRNPERSDILDALLPAWMEARRQIRSGVVPLWNPLPAGGRPALLDPVTAEMTVGFALFAATPDPALGFYLCVLSSLVIAGLGMHRLIARYYSPWAAVFGGISYMACGFITAWLFWPHTHSAIWIPWLLIAVDSFARRGSRYGFVGISIFTALMFLGGFPFVVALGLGAAMVHAFMAAVTQQDRGRLVPRLAGTVAAIGLGFALVALPLLSFFVGIDSADMGYRHGGSALTFVHDVKLLVMPWAGQAPAVEKNMYVGMAALLLAALGLLALAKANANALAWSGVAFVAVGATLVFGLLPREIGAHLPVLSNNPWSRSILLLDFGLILLAASGLDFLSKHVKRGPAMLALGAFFCIIQGVDLGRQFRKFNGATPAKYFYPVSPELAMLKNKIGPFQYVAQDSSYFVVSGTLGAIGLGEWFAHSLRSPQLHNLLDALADNPFSSPTATSIRASDFHLSDDLADVIALCYVVFPTATNGGSVIAQSKGRDQLALPPINNLTVSQTVRLPGGNVSAIAIRMANYRGHDVDGTVTATLRAADGRAIGSGIVPASEVVDNAMTTFRFDDAPLVEPGDYTLQLNYVPGPRQRNLTVWILKDVAGDVHRGDEVIPGSLTYLIFGAHDSSLSILAQGPMVTVAENPGCAKGPFWTADLTDPQPGPRSDRAKLIHYEPAFFSIRSTATDPGFVVVPMQHLKGWKATVDGRETTIQLVKGVLPAVPVPAGTSSVQFVYRPPHWRVGLAISAAAALILAWVGGFGRKRLSSSATLIRAGAGR